MSLLELTPHRILTESPTLPIEQELYTSPSNVTLNSNMINNNNNNNNIRGSIINDDEIQLQDIITSNNNNRGSIINDSEIQLQVNATDYNSDNTNTNNNNNNNNDNNNNNNNSSNSSNSNNNNDDDSNNDDHNAIINSIPREELLLELLPSYETNPSDEVVINDLTKLNPDFQRRFPFSPQPKPRISAYRIFPLFILGILTIFPMLNIVALMSIPCMYCFPHLSFRLMKVFFKFWLDWFISVIEILLNYRILIRGYKGQLKPRSLIIMNHISHMDWLWFFSYVIRTSSFMKLTIILKRDIRYIPVLGWALQTMLCIFLNRNWEQDQKHIENVLSIHNMYDDDVNVLLFPEGADYNPLHVLGSLKFAAKNSLEPYFYTLHPKVKGFVYIVQIMRKRGLDAIYDITNIYPDDIAKKEIDFIKGHVPREVYYYTREYKATEIPEDELELIAWCQERWKEKEMKIKEFYRIGRLSETPECPHEQLRGAELMFEGRQMFVKFLYGNLFTISLTTLGILGIYYLNMWWCSFFWSSFLILLNFLPIDGIDGYIRWCHKNCLANSSYK